MPGVPGQGGSGSGGEQSGAFADSVDQTTWVYGNGVPGNEAVIEDSDFQKDDNGNYNFQWVFFERKKLRNLLKLKFRGSKIPGKNLKGGFEILKNFKERRIS